MAICAHTPAAAVEAPRPQTVGLVISGGVSEGAYQAGATYAFMKFLLERRKFDTGPDGKQDPTRDFRKQLSEKETSSTQTCGLTSAATPSLDVAAGSSAGNINAFLAGLTWCGNDKESERFKPRETCSGTAGSTSDGMACRPK